MGNVIQMPIKADFNNNKYIIDSFISTRNSDGTKRMYQMEIEKFAEWLKKPLTKAEKQDLLLYANKIKVDYDHETTRQRIFTSIRSLYKWLSADMEWLESNPCKGTLPRVTPPRNPNDKVLMVDEIEAIKKVAANDPRDYALITLLSTTGFRISEAISIKWKDIMRRPKGGFMVRVIRKGNQECFVPLRDDAVAVLNYYRQAAGVKKDDDMFIFSVFYGKKYKQISTEYVRQILGGLAETAGVEKEVTAHWFRHTYASQTLAEGAALTDVQRDMNHKDIKTTTIYLHALSDSCSSYFPVTFSIDEMKGLFTDDKKDNG